MRSPQLGKLIQLTNTPSDNFFGEMMLKNLGAELAGAGTTAAGARVVHRELRTVLGINPRFNDGSALSRYDSTSPRQVVTLLRDLSGNATFVHSLAIAGKTGTLIDEMRGTRPREIAVARQGHSPTWPAWSATAAPAMGAGSRLRSS